MMVMDGTATVPPDVIEVELRLRSAPLVPTVPWTIAVPSDFTRRKNVAVPVAFALESVVMEFAVSTPPDAEPANEELRASSARSVLPERAVLTSAGGVPL